MLTISTAARSLGREGAQVHIVAFSPGIARLPSGENKNIDFKKFNLLYVLGSVTELQPVGSGLF